MKNLLFIIFLFISSIGFAADRAQLDDGQGNIMGTSSNPVHINCVTGCSGGGGGTNYWTLGGGNIYNNTGNNVGIGSINPSQALDVNGTVKASTSFIAGSGLGTITGDSNGNIGIGQPTPLASLDVNGTTKVTNLINTGVTASSLVYVNSSQQESPVTLTTTGTSGAASFITGTLNIPQYSATSQWVGSSGSNIYYTGANVGIGTNIPGQQLDVGGTARIIGSGSSGNTVTPLLLNQPYSAGGTGSIIRWHNSLSTSNVYPDVQIQGLASTLTTNAGEFDIGTSNGSGTMADRFRIEGGGNVGIGTFIIPNGRLVVKGNGVSTIPTLQTTGSTNAIGLTVEDVGNVGIGTTLPLSVLALATNNTPGLAIGQLAQIGNFSPPNNGIYIQGNMGIGTTLYGSALTIKGTIEQATSASLSPTISSCGSTPNGSSVGNDNHFTITVGGTATACTATFRNTTYTNSHCNVTNQSMSITSALGYTETGTAITITQAVGLGGDLLDVNCGFDQ